MYWRQKLQGIPLRALCLQGLRKTCRFWHWDTAVQTKPPRILGRRDEPLAEAEGALGGVLRSWRPVGSSRSAKSEKRVQRRVRSPSPEGRGAVTGGKSPGGDSPWGGGSPSAGESQSRVPRQARPCAGRVRRTGASRPHGTAPGSRSHREGYTQGGEQWLLALTLSDGYPRRKETKLRPSRGKNWLHLVPQIAASIARARVLGLRLRATSQ